MIHAVALLMNERPILIVLGGDYVTWGDRQYVGPSADALSPLSAPHGVYGILGNHDDDHDMPAALAARGVHMLKDARTAITIKGEVVDSVGIRFWTKRASDIATVMKGATGTVFLLAHDPRRLTEAAALKIPLVLSGHTHGGQSWCRDSAPSRSRIFPCSGGSAGANGRRCSSVAESEPFTSPSE